MDFHNAKNIGFLTFKQLHIDLKRIVWEVEHILFMDLQA